MRDQVLDDRRAVDLEEEVLVGLLVLPPPRRFRFQLGPGAHRDQHRAVRPAVDQRLAQARAGERRAVEARRRRRRASASTPRARRSTAGRARRTRPRPPRPAPRPGLRGGARADSRAAARTRPAATSTSGRCVDRARSSAPPRSRRLDRLELAAVDEEVEEPRMRLEAAVLDPPAPVSSSSARFARESSAMRRAFDRRVADLDDLRSGRFGIRPMRCAASTSQVPAEPAGEVEHVDVVERRCRTLSNTTCSPATLAPLAWASSLTSLSSR